MQAQTVYLYLFDGLSDWEPAFAVAGINDPQSQCAPGAFAVRDGGVITAPGTAPLEFAREIFSALALYPPVVLAAWYQLFETAERKYFDAQMQAAG